MGIDLGPPDDFDEWCAQNKVPMIFGTFNLRAPLEKAGASKARSIIFASGDELVTQGIVDLTGIFEPAQASDLLRSKIISSSTMH